MEKGKKKDLWSLLCSEELCHYKGFEAFFSLQRKKPLLGFIKLAKGEKKLKEKKTFPPFPFKQFFVRFVICSLLLLMVELWIQGLKVLSWISHSPPVEQIPSLLPGPKPSLSSRLCKSKADKCELSGANLLEIFLLVIGFIFQLLEKVVSHYHPCLLPQGQQRER